MEPPIAFHRLQAKAGAEAIDGGERPNSLGTFWGFPALKKGPKASGLKSVKHHPFIE